MTEEEREKHLFALDEELLKGSVMFSAWCHFMILESDAAFIAGTHLAAILTAVSAIETHLRFEYSQPGDKLRLAQLIDASDLPLDLKRDLHEVRRYRNRWVHVSDPWDESLVRHMEDPVELQAEIEPIALLAVTALRRTFYWNQGT
jgi:hypothetical protein